MNGKVVVITGAGSGLGRELAKIFVQLGAHVAGLGRSLDTLNETKSLVIQPDKFHCYSVDVSDFSSVASTIDSILDSFDRIDYLINNAAIYNKLNFLEERADVFAAAINTNIVGIANTCKAVLPAMISANFGTIVNVSSWAHKRPIANSASYSASKGAVHALTKAIATDVERDATDVTLVEWIPGHMNTQMSEFTGMNPAICAQWCADIIQSGIVGNYAIYEGGQRWQEPLSFKKKIKKILFRK